MKKRIVALVLLACVLMVGSAMAHVPAGSSGNNSIENASVIEQPTKSWAIYSEIKDTDEAIYYKFHMDRGDRLRIQLYTPVEDFAPGVVLMGPNLTSSGTVPDFVEVRQGYDARVYWGKFNSTKGYEPFTPASYYYPLDIDTTANDSGWYYIALFDTSKTGNVGIAIGYIEEFSAVEWLQVPFNTITIHLWEGQNIALVLAPLIITMVAGALLLFAWARRGLDIPLRAGAYIGIGASLLYIGSAFTTLTQMAIASSDSNPGGFGGITMLFIVFPMLLGAIILVISARPKKRLNIKARLGIFLAGAFGIVFWAGFVIGPAMAMIASIAPGGEMKEKERKVKSAKKSQEKAEESSDEDEDEDAEKEQEEREDEEEAIEEEGERVSQAEDGAEEQEEEEEAAEEGEKKVAGDEDDTEEQKNDDER